MLYATAAKLWAIAADSNPRLAVDRKVHHRYNAACAAVLAASGNGEDTSSVTDAERAIFRKQALGWLRAELTT